MNDLSHRFPLSRPHPCAPLLEAIRNGQFDGISTCVYPKHEWARVAVWFHDVRGEPEDAAQALDEAAEMIAKSDYYPNWQALSEVERDYWQDYDTFFEARGRFGRIASQPGCQPSGPNQLRVLAASPFPSHFAGENP